MSPVLPVLLAGVLACTGKGTDDGDSGVGDGGSGDGGGLDVCEDVGSATGTAVGVGSSADGTSSFEEYGCGGGEAPDLAWTWTAPGEGCYRVHTLSTGFDTVLTVLDGGCGGAQVACNDDEPSGEYQSALDFEAVDGATYTLVVDGYQGSEQGDIVLAIFACDADPTGQVVDLGSAEGEAVAVGGNGGEDTSLDSDCGPYLEDVVFSWTAPRDGGWRFTTAGSDFDTILSVWNTALGIEAMCSDDDEDIGDGTSTVELPLPAGAEVLVGIGGYGGASGVYVLGITEVEEPGTGD